MVGVRSREVGGCVSEGKAARLFCSLRWLPGCLGSRAEHKSGHALSPCVSQTRGEKRTEEVKSVVFSVFLEITQGSSFKVMFKFRA